MGKRRNRNNELLERIRQLETHAPVVDKISSGDWILFCLAGAMALALFVIERTPTNVAIVLIGILGLLLHPALHLPWVTRAAGRTRIIRRTVSVLVAVVVVSGFGYSQWPKPNKRHLSYSQMRTFEEKLTPPANEKAIIEIVPISNDIEAYEFAQQLSLAFGIAGWDVQPKQLQTYIAGVTPLSLVISYKFDADKRVQVIVDAFKAIGYPVEKQFNPKMVLSPPLANDLVIYVGTKSSD